MAPSFLATWVAGYAFRGMALRSGAGPSSARTKRETFQPCHRAKVAPMVPVAHVSALPQESDVDLLSYGEGGTRVLRLDSLAPRTSSPSFNTADLQPEKFSSVVACPRNQTRKRSRLDELAAFYVDQAPLLQAEASGEGRLARRHTKQAALG